MRMAEKVALAYGVCALINGVFGHIVLFKFYFNYPLVVLILQTAVLLLAVECARISRLVKISGYTFARGRELLPLSLFQVLAQLGVMSSLDGLERPLFGTIQALAPALGLVLHFFWRWCCGDNRLPAFNVVALVGGATLCGVIATFVGFELEIWSVLYSAIALALSVLSALIAEYHIAGASVADVIYVNAFNSLCLLLIADVIQDELRDAMLFMMTNAGALFAFYLALLAAAGAAGQVLYMLAVEHSGAVGTLLASNCAAALKVSGIRY